MGTFMVRAKVWNILSPNKIREVNLTTGTSATYTTLPASILRELAVRKSKRMKFRMANGRSVVRNVGEIGIEVEGKRWLTVGVLLDRY